MTATARGMSWLKSMNVVRPVYKVDPVTPTCVLMPLNRIEIVPLNLTFQITTIFTYFNRNITGKANIR